MIRARMRKGGHDVILAKVDGEKATLTGGGYEEASAAFYGSIPWNSAFMGGSYLGFDAEDPVQVLDALVWFDSKGWDVQVLESPARVPLGQEQVPEEEEQREDWGLRYDIPPDALEGVDFGDVVLAARTNGDRE